MIQFKKKLLSKIFIDFINSTLNVKRQLERIRDITKRTLNVSLSIIKSRKRYVIEMTSLSQTYKNLINLPCLKRSIAIPLPFYLKIRMICCHFQLKAGQQNLSLWICLASAFVSWLAASSLLVTIRETGSTTHTCMTLFFELWIRLMCA